LEASRYNASAGRERLCASTSSALLSAKGRRPVGTLFAAYVSELRRAKQDVEEWWKTLIDAEEKRTGDRKQAVQNVKERRPPGPVIHGSIQAIIRKYWLECAKLNQVLVPSDQVPPEDLLLGWLMNGENEDLAEFLSAIRYWPIGMDHKGNWV
jgi:hypothetical protein